MTMAILKRNRYPLKYNLLNFIKVILDVKRILDIDPEKDLLESLQEIAINMANLDGFVSGIKELFDLDETINN